MTALVLDAGALVAIDRDDRAMAARLRVALDHGIELRTHPMVIAQAWRDGRRQANLARFLKAVRVIDIDTPLGKAAGALCGAAGTSDPIDAAVVLIAERGDAVVTGDPGDLGLLLDAAAVAATIVAI